MKTNRSLKQNSNRLAAYLATGIGAGLVAIPQSDAAIITIDLSDPSYSGLGSVNGGVPYGQGRGMAFPGTVAEYGGGLNVYNMSTTLGLSGFFGLGFAAGVSEATPTKFTIGQAINSSSSFVSNYNSVFLNGANESSDFGSGSYMGFKTMNGRYGWIEVTWTSAVNQFQIFSAAYEDVIGLGISAGDVGSAAVPEPGQVASSLLLLALGSAGVAIQRRRAKKKLAVAGAQS
jgi:hypothetical protein